MLFIVAVIAIVAGIVLIALGRPPGMALFVAGLGLLLFLVLLGGWRNT